MVRALASHQCGPGSNPGVDAICGLSLLLVLPLAPRGFSPGTPVFPSPDVLPANRYLFLFILLCDPSSLEDLENTTTKSINYTFLFSSGKENDFLLNSTNLSGNIKTKFPDFSY